MANTTRARNLNICPSTNYDLAKGRSSQILSGGGSESNFCFLVRSIAATQGGSVNTRNVARDWQRVINSGKNSHSVKWTGSSVSDLIMLE